MPTYHRPKERPFTRDERSTTKILFGGLTWKHERLIQGAWEGLGYLCEPLPTPTVESYQIGREYGNTGICNPSYFTVGNLIWYLQRLEAAGMSREEIIRRHVFVTAGSCGPCRFGMYESEYRLSLRNAGFDGFRVIIFQQSDGLDQSDGPSGLEMNVDFFIGVLRAFILGDLVNDLAYQIRPYEVVPGATDEVLRESIELLYQALKKNRTVGLPSWRKFLTELTRRDFSQILSEVGRRFDAIEVDRTERKPIVKITGEFWAMTTEGDGNFNTFSFLESEGAEVQIDLLANWILYMLHQAVQGERDRKGLDRASVLPGWDRFWQRLPIEWRHAKKLFRLKSAEWIFRREWRRLRHTLRDLPQDLADQYHLQRLARPYFNSRAGGGEGHLEVAKNIATALEGRAQMVLSLKPFGCMPSTQSDGAQAAVVSHYPETLYLPIETSGEGTVNAHSRMQMALGEAKRKLYELPHRPRCRLDDGEGGRLREDRRAPHLAGLSTA